MSTRTQIILGALGLFILVGVGYVIFFGNKDTSNVTVTQSGAAASDVEVLFLNLSAELSSISFDTKIFSDPRFTALTDIHTSVLTESEGRHDPFASIGSQ